MTKDQSETGAGATPAPVCYRHPDRETWVSCTRCERPICPDCMNAASVGFQCPECVREGAKTVRSARTAFGGRLDGERGEVTTILLAANAIAFVATVALGLLQGGVNNAMSLLVGSGGDSVLYRLFAMAPSTWASLPDPSDPTNLVLNGGVADGEYWRLITGGFLHAGILHLLLNMWALHLFGREVERMLGRARYLALYLLAGLGGSVGVYLWSVGGGSTVGASGSVFGLFGALFFFLRKLRLDPRQLLILIALNFGLTFFFSGYISWQAHVGGFVTGGVLGALLAYAPRGPSRTVLQVVGMVVVGLALVGAVMFQTVNLTSA